uniref:tRNA (32-2'-O)-methyltransferase regulator THADA n=1 Tax=Strigamia maritima TaxID=126957 RepID=T1J611_STRMM
MPSRKQREFQNSRLEKKEDYLQEIQGYLNPDDRLPCIEWLHEFLQSEDAIHQANLIKQIRQSFQKMQSTCQDQVLLCCRVLADVYMGLDLKNILKRTVASALQGSPIEIHESVAGFLQDALVIRLHGVAEDTEEEKLRRLVDDIIACFDNFPLGERCLSACVINVLEFSNHVLILLTQLLRKNCSPLEATLHCQSLQALVRSLVLVLQKCAPSIQALLTSSSKRDFVLEMLAHIVHNVLACLNDDGILLDCRMHCGMAVPLLLKFIVGADYFPVILQVAYPQKSEEEKGGSSGDAGDPKFNIEQQLEGLPADLPFTLSLLGALPTTSQLCLTCGLLCTVHLTDLGKEEPADTASPLVEILLPELMRISNSGDSTITINCCKGLLLWTQRVKDLLENSTRTTHLHRQFLEGSSHVNQQLMDFLWSHWEHFIDGVRHFARDIFNNILSIHRLIVGKDVSKSTFVQELTCQLLMMPSHHRSKYFALCSLVDFVGAREILQQQPTIPQDLLSAMEEKSVASYASELFEKLFVTHFKEMREDLPKWQLTWVTPTLTALSQDSSVIDLTLTQLLKCNPDTLHYITSVLIDEEYPTSGASLGALLKAMKTARSIGLIKNQSSPSTYQNLWNDVLSYSVLYQALRHIKDEIRLDAFALICETHKTTELIPRSDLELVGTFLSENISNQSSAFRQQIIAYIKKLINRIRDGGQVLLKKRTALQKKNKIGNEILTLEGTLTYYQDFLTWLASLQFSSLHLGANFPRRGTALQILDLLHQQIGFQSSDNYFLLTQSLTYQNVQTLLECLRDSYEVNKNLAGNILKVIPAELMGFQDEHRLSAIFEAALALASSPHPSESVSAAYILRLLVHYPLTLSIAMATKQFLEDQSKMGQDTSGRNTPAVDMQTRENSSLQEYLLHNIKVDEKTQDLMDSTFAVLEVLLFQLQIELECAKFSLLEAANSAPMYGLLFCIRMLLAEVDFNLAASYEYWFSFVSNLLELCFLLNEVVAPIVNNSSPEGHLPMDSEPETLIALHATLEKALGYNTEKLSHSSSDEACGKARSVTAQMVLLCSWRTVKEISLLLGDLCQRSPLPEDNDQPFLLTHNQVLRIGDYFTCQLAETKHRGAFEQAYVGFCKMCSRLWSVKGELHHLPKQWLQDLLQQIQDSSSSPKLCKTRRSAGIPFMVQALVTSEPAVTNSACLKEVMQRLLQFSLDTQYSDLDAHVHALNILRVLYRDMHLGETVMPFVADGMKAAILGFKGKIWAVRNSSTLLFSALMTRIFGVKRGKDEYSRKNCMTGRVFFQRFPSLYQFLYNELAADVYKSEQSFVNQDGTKLGLQPSLYPILLLLARLYPSALEGSDSNLKLSAFVPHIQTCSSSAIIKTRNLAAQALIPLISINSYDTELENFINSLPEKPEEKLRQNHIHGVLLQIQHLLLELHVVPHEVLKNISENFESWMRNRIWICTRSNPCLFTKISYLNILDIALSNKLINLDSQFISDIQHILLEELDNFGYEMFTPGFPLYRAIMARFLLTIYVFTLNIAGINASVHWSTSELSALARSVSGGDLKGQALYHHDTTVPNWSSSEDSTPSKQDDFNSLKQFFALVCRLLCDEYYEVRLTVMRWMRALLQNDYQLATLIENDEVILNLPKSICVLIDSRQGQFCAQQLLMSKNVILALVAMATEQEEHPECVIELFHLLCLFPLAIQLPWPDPEEPNKSLNSLEKLDIILQRGEAELRDELRCSLLRFSGYLVSQVYLDLAEAPEGIDLQPRSILEEWADAFLLCCSSEQSLNTRRTAAEVLFSVANYLLIDPHNILGAASCLVWSALVRLLMDDDPGIKRKVSEIINIFESFPPLPGFNQNGLEWHPFDVQPTVALDLVVGYFVEQFGDKYQTECLTTLLDWCLREETNEAFLQEEERIFDKGEMNIYAEEITVTNVVIKHLKRLLRHVFGGIKLNTLPNNPFSEENVKGASLANFGDIDRGDIQEKQIPESLTSDSLAVLSMSPIIKDRVMTNFTIPTYQVTSWLPSADNLEHADHVLLRDIVSMVSEELIILLSEIPAITNKSPFVCRHFERQILRTYRRVMVVTSLGKYDVTQRQSMIEIENMLM